MDSIVTPRFWQDEQQRLYDVIARLVALSYLAGAQNGMSLLPPAVAQLANFDFVNESAIQFLHQYQLNTVAGISETTRKQAITAIDQWARSGEHLDVLKAKLATVLSPSRAGNIATTEVTRIFAEGNKALWKSTGLVTAKVWQTARDERVCPICRPLHGKIVGIDDVFLLSPQEIAESPAMRQLLGKNYTPEGALQRAVKLVSTFGSVQVPPAHPRCRCWLKPVVSEQALRNQLGDILAQELFANVVTFQGERAYIL